MEKINYNPSAQYTWLPEDVFELTGKEFGLILNALRAVLNTEEAARILLTHQASLALENVMKDSVEKGIIKEVAKENNNNLKVVK